MKKEQALAKKVCQELGLRVKECNWQVVTVLSNVEYGTAVDSIPGVVISMVSFSAPNMMASSNSMAKESKGSYQRIPQPEQIDSFSPRG